MIRTRHIHLLGLLCMLLMCACQGSPCLSGYAKVDMDGWYAADTLVIELQKGDTTKVGMPAHQAALTTGVRFTDDYAYRNLALVVELESDGCVEVRDTVSFCTYDSKDRPMGHGSLFHNLTAQTSALTLCPWKQYTARITHIMRSNPLAGVSDVSVTIE